MSKGVDRGLRWLSGHPQAKGGDARAGVVIVSPSRGDRRDVINNNKTTLPKSPLSKATTSLAYFMWFEGAGPPPYTFRI